ncbi:DUF3558 domain-containing protein [Nocardiopsis gilva]
MGGDYPPPPKRTGLWIALGVGAVLLVLTLVGVVITLAVSGLSGSHEADRPRSEKSDGGNPSEDADGAQDPGSDPSRYTGPDEPTKVEIGSAPHKLPKDPCAALSKETRVGLGIDGEKGEATETADSLSICNWYHLADDGTFHNVRITYTLPPDDNTSVSKAEYLYNFYAEEGVGILGDRVEDEKSDVGDESIVVLTKMDDEGHHEATALVRKDNMMIEVDRGISPNKSDTSGEPTMRWADVQKLMPELGRQALNNVG